jgi:hypothetical protein
MTVNPLHNDKKSIANYYKIICDAFFIGNYNCIWGITNILNVGGTPIC